MKPESVERDLLKVFDELNQQYFNNQIVAGIGWRRMRTRKKYITVGLCSIHERFIEINIILKDKRVPYWFLKYIVYHEMLHLVHGLGHSEPFLTEEKTYPDYERSAKFFEEDIVDVYDDWVIYFNETKRGTNGKDKGKNINNN